MVITTTRAVIVHSRMNDIDIDVDDVDADS
jgi:hypothetical protein